MAIPFRTPIDLNGLEIQNAVAHVLGSDPGSPVDGQFWYRSDTGLLSVRESGVTIRLGRLDQITAPSAAVSFNSQRITSLADPSSAQDAATKNYVDGLVGGGIAWKQPVRAATTANGTLASAFENGDTIDGVTLATGDRILIKDQTTGSENGIYTVNASGAPTRATDADTASEILQATVFVREGTTNADLAFTLTNDTITLGTTALTFVQISGLGQITAGNGLTKSGNTLNVGAGTGITVNADDVQISASYVGQTSITTLGTITTGTWNATDIAVADGGTGRSSLTNHGVLVGAGTGAITQLGVGTTGQVLVGSTGADPAFGSIDLASSAAVGSSILPIANGGTNASSASGAKTNLGFMTRFAGDVGDGSATSIDVTHNLGTKDVHVTVWDNTTPFAEQMVEVRHKTTNVVTLVFAVAPTTNQFRVVVIG